MHRITTLLITAAALCAEAAEPENFYSSCEGKSGKELLHALNAVVGPHTNVGYDGLWNVYKTSDVRADGSLWDIYSTKRWPSDFTRCGNYAVIGDCVNREHSFPKSWFGGDKNSPMYADAYHLYPTDGKVNGLRSNYPYGECANGTTERPVGEVKALGKKGKSTFPGYSDIVFEPDDEYKGDLARSYFYMAAAYNDKIAGWNSDMLAGNDYPAYTSWAVSLLLKWNRQDPVSTKETDRNEAISAYQQNRNPFIDHPELSEYIWGDKTGTPWYIGAESEPRINTPSDGTVIGIGATSVGITRSRTIYVAGANLEADVKVNVSGTGFSVSPAQLTASAVNAENGAPVTVSYKSDVATEGEGQLVLRSGDITVTCPLSCRAEPGLPAGPASDITESSFTARWSCIDNPATEYTLDVIHDGASITGYPVSVPAGDEEALVENLQPETTYTYTVASATMTSKPVEVTTTAPIPSVVFLYDGELEFTSIPGEPSEIAEILLHAENIPGNITISVSAPFQVSTDKTSWSTNVILLPDEERFYMRLLGQTEGKFSTSVTATAEGYVNDDLDVDGTIIADTPTFHEDFEPKGDGSYDEKTYVGSACTWSTDAYFRSGSDNFPHEGNQAARMHNKRPGHLTMLESKQGGIGILSLWARLWRTESKTVTLNVSLSSDMGDTWESIGAITIEPIDNGAGNRYMEYTLPVNRPGSLRIKLEQDIASRTMIDDIRLTDYRTTSIENANSAEYHSWDAFCRNGQLVMESNGTSEDFANVYGYDGTEHFAGLLPEGETTLDLAPGLYIVVVRDFSRRVIVK